MEIKEIITEIIVPLLSGVLGGILGGNIIIKKYINKQTQNNNSSFGVQVNSINNRRKR